MENRLTSNKKVFFSLEVALHYFKKYKIALRNKI